MNDVHETAVIYPDVKLGDGVRIDANSTIGSYPLLTRRSRMNKRLVRKRCEGSVQIDDDVDIGPNVVIHRGSKRDTVVRRGTFIGSFVNVGHDSIIGENCIISPRVTLLGWVEIGDNSFIGAGTEVRERVKIGSGAFIGMGSLVLDDVEDRAYGYGRPFEVKRRKINVVRMLRRLGSVF